jgi:hypothetical protein
LRSPDFFIVGAPKCGTTALYSYLGQHPEIFMPGSKGPHRTGPVPAGKEPHFLGSDLEFIGRRRPASTLAEYLAFFVEATDEKRVGEASTLYWCSKRSAIEIKEFCPSASIIIALRNPVDMMYSLHSQRRFGGTEDIEDFGAALEAEADRKEGRRLPRCPGVVQGLFYRETARYGQQVERFFDTFGRERVQVIIFDDLIDDPAGTYRQTLRFLGVREDFQPRFEVVNRNKQARSATLRGLVQSPPGIVRRVAGAVVPVAIRRALLGGLWRLNSKYVQRPPMDRRLRRSLQEEFSPEVARLGDLLGRDLSHWTRGPE